MIIIACPNCSKELRFSDSDPRAVRTCSECGSEFRYHPDSSRTQEPVLLSTPPESPGDLSAEAPAAPEAVADPLLMQELADPPMPPPGHALSSPAWHRSRFERLPVRPWRRYFARLADIVLVGLAVGIALWNLVPENDLLAGFLVLVIWIPVEAVLLSTWGTTPGKWMLATRVRTRDGDCLPFTAALKRSADVWVRGLGLGLPIVTLVTMAIAYNTLKSKGLTSWDAADGWVVSHREAGLPQIIALTVAAGLVLVVLMFAFIPAFSIEADLIAAVENAAASLEKMGATVRFIGDIQTGELNSGEQAVLTVALEEGVETFIYGVCDVDCLDLDMAVAGLGGETIWVDEQPDAEPVAYFTPEDGGEHTITVSMYDCQIEPCYYAVGVMALEGLDVGPSFGTCFTVSPAGLVMTALHVVDSDEVIHVHFADGTVAEAEVLRFSEAHDVAVLSTGQARDEYLTFASAETLDAGDSVFTIGFPAPEILGDEPKFTEGAVSALSGPGGDDAFLQMSAPVQPGNSGGPLMNYAGQVVGVVESTMGSRAFEAQTGALPQNINWAVKGAYAALLLGDDAPAPLPPTTREGAIERAQAAVCSVVVGEIAEEAAPEGQKGVPVEAEAVEAKGVEAAQHRDGQGTPESERPADGGG